MRLITNMQMVVMVVVMMVMVMPVSSQEKDIDSTSDENKPEMDNWISRLYQDKMKNYHKNARPVINHNHPTVVYLGLSLQNIHLDDVKQELSVNAWTIMTWTDELLRWVPEDYMNLDRIHFDLDDIWLPDITVYNSAMGSESHPFQTVPVLVDNKGKTYWFPPTHIRVNCDLDLTTWPRDEHVCLVRMGSWAHHGEQIDIQNYYSHNDTEMMTDSMEENNRWKLVNVTVTRNLTNLEKHDPYVEVNFSFRVRRQARTQATFITQSTLVVVVVVLATYILPLHCFLSRLVMHLFSLGVLISCFFTLFTILPATGGPIPVVVRYYSGSIILTTLSLLSTLCLTTRFCCCCTGCSSSSGLAKTLVGILTPASRLRRATIPQANSSAGRNPYNHFENEISVEEEEEERRPQATQLNQQGGQGGSARYIRLQEDVVVPGGGGGEGDRLTSNQFFKVINYLLMTLFTIAFVVDYVVLRNVTL